jgi:DASS family divalent anion:Na+ symporter
VVAVLAIGAVVASSGLLYRLALLAVSLAQGSYLKQVLALGIAGFVVSPTVPNATSRVTLIAPAVAEITEALGYAPRSRRAAGLAMAALLGFGLMAAPFLTSSTTTLLVYSVLPETARSGLDWTTWALRALPSHLLLFAGLLGVILWWYGRGADEPAPHPLASPEGGSDPLPPGASGAPQGSLPDPAPDAEPAGTVLPAHSALDLQRALLGPLTRAEKLTLGITIGLLVGFVSQPLHGLDPAWLGVLALVALGTVGVLPADVMRTGVNWSFALLVGILGSMSQVFSGVGLDRWLAGLAAGLLGGLTSTPVVFVLALSIACLAVSLVLRWQAAAPLLTIALAPMAEVAGIDPWVIALVAIVACNGFFISYQSTIYLALYHGTSGQLFSHRQARPLAFAYGLLVPLSLAASVPLWQSMGLL